MKRTLEESLETRQLILNTARTLFANKGFDSTSTTDITEQSSLTRGALYHHFQNKEVLFQEIVTTYEANWDTWYAETVLVLPDTQSQLKTFFVGYLTHLIKEPALREYASILRQPVSERTRDLVAHINQKGEQFVGQQFARWLKKIGAPKDKLEMQAHSLTALFIGLEHLIVTGVITKESTVTQIWETNDLISLTNK
jgi:AcrR family transcriptional regulator